MLSNLGEALDNATLFVHISVTEKWAGEVFDARLFIAEHLYYAHKKKKLIYMYVDIFFLAATSDAENKDEEKQKAGHNSNVGYQAN